MRHGPTSKIRRIACAAGGAMAVAAGATVAALSHAGLAMTVSGVCGGITGAVLLPLVVEQFLNRSGDTSGNLNILAPAGCVGGLLSIAGALVPWAGPFLGVVPGGLLGLWANSRYENAKIDQLRREHLDG
ncbi:MAG: hypothetical protein HY319_05625 [Armatimonadetes bacterium]|nr:hypothetical protein [Armatimonadota bacterium]